MSGARRFKSLRRKVETRHPKSKITIYSEGNKTERDYFDEMRRYYHEVAVEIKFIGGVGVPITIATKAIQDAQSASRRNHRQSYTARDEFWAVFDRDTHPNVPEAISRCESANVGVAFSNPCFEVWLILHYQDYDRPDGSNAVQRHLGTLCPDYDCARRKTTDCRRLMDRVAVAEERAERQWRRREDEGDPPGPPFSTVYKLTRQIRNGPRNT